MPFDSLPIESLFIFLLILSDNFLAGLFPCRFQRDFVDIIAVKHIFGFLTLLFFVVLQSELESFNLFNSFKYSSILYIIFLLLINSMSFAFLASMALLTVSYLLTLKMRENSEINGDANEQQLGLRTMNDNMKQIQSYLHLFIIIIIILGFLSNLGSKKSEFKTKFSYVTFLFGKKACANNNVRGLSYIDGLKNTFS